MRRPEPTPGSAGGLEEGGGGVVEPPASASGGPREVALGSVTATASASAPAPSTTPRRVGAPSHEGAARLWARLRAALEEAHDAERLLEAQRRDLSAARQEAEARRQRAAAHAGGPHDPRAQGLWDAAAFHAARARQAAARLSAAEARASLVWARAEAARRVALAGARGRGLHRCE